MPTKKERRPRAGQPAIVEDPEEMRRLIDEYFENPPVRTMRTKDGKTYEVEVPTITGLALHCGFASRQSFYDYLKRENFSYVMKRGQSKIVQNYEELLQTGGGAGAIFALKNMGWKDRFENDNTQKVIVEWDDPSEKEDEDE